MYKKDWLLNQIDDLIDFLVKVFLNKLICDKKINEAENLLFDKIDVQNPKHLAIAINFFDKLNKLTDETLDSSNYSREEINQGLNDILDKFGIKIDFK